MFQKQLQRILDDIIGKGGTEVSAAIYYKGKCVAAAAAGGEDGQAEISDRFNVGSVSKVYCAAAVMQLAAEKKVTLDTKVCQLLPQFHMADSRYRHITLRMCLNHSSGLPGTGMKMAFQTEFLYDEFKKAFFDYLSHGRLKAEPGSFSVYCNDGFDLAAFAVEEITGLPYSRYLKQAILEPIGAESSGCGTDLRPGKLVRERGACYEYLACVGSGGIVTNLTDCARFGSLFAGNNGGILSAESIHELSKAQGRSREENPQSLHYGLGWDTTSLEGIYDFGPGALGKSGGTSQFASYLLVSPKYELSAAISATKDTKITPQETVSQIAAAFLKKKGIDVVKDKERCMTEAKPAKLSGIDGLYFGNRALYRLSSKDSTFVIDEFTPSGWRNFTRNPAGFALKKRKGAVDLMMKWNCGNLVLAQKFLETGSVPESRKTKWEQRIGKSYLVCNGHPGDLDIGDMVNGITLYRADGAESEFEKSLILFCAVEAGGFRMMPALAADDDTTAYVLDGEGSPGCRDTFTPFIESASGAEILYDGGVRYIDTKSLPKLASQTVRSDEAERNPVFRTDAGCRITLYKPQQVKVLLFDENLLPYYDERRHSIFPLTKRGYAVFLNREPFTAEVSCENRRETGEQNEF